MKSSELCKVVVRLKGSVKKLADNCVHLADPRLEVTIEFPAIAKAFPDTPGTEPMVKTFPLEKEFIGDYAIGDKHTSLEARQKNAATLVESIKEDFSFEVDIETDVD